MKDNGKMGVGMEKEKRRIAEDSMKVILRMTIGKDLGTLNLLMEQLMKDNF